MNSSDVRGADSGAIAAVEGVWSHIEQAGGVATPYQSIAWIDAWLRHCSPGDAPEFRVLQDGDTLAPLGTIRVAGLRVRRLLGSGESDYPGLVSCRPTGEAWDAVAADLARERGFDLLSLSSVPDHDAILTALEAHMPARPIHRVYETCPRIPVDQSWEELLKARSRDFRKSVRRWGRRVEGFGETHVEVLEPPISRALLDELEEVERASWKWESGDASFRSESQRAFLSTLLLDPRMSVRLWLLRIDGALAAFAFVPVGRDAWYFYLSTFRKEFAHSGSHLLALIVEAACEDPECQWVDLLRGSFDYKTAWTSESRLVHEIVCPVSLPGRALALAYRARWWAAESERLHRLRSRMLGVGDRRATGS